jgi:hypothetical protein
MADQAALADSSSIWRVRNLAAAKALNDAEGVSRSSGRRLSLTRATAEQDECLQLGVGQYTGSDVLFEHVGRGDVDGHREERFGFAAEGNQVEERSVGLEIDEKVEVPCSFGIARRGSEDPQVADAPLPRGRVQLAGKSSLKHLV